MDIVKLQNFKRENYGVFLPYIDNMDITDIEWTGHKFVITDLVKGKYEVKEHGITEKFIIQFITHIANLINFQFNPVNGIMEAETTDWRILVIHDSIAVTGTVITLRRITAVRRLNTAELVKNQEYCPKEMLAFLINCMKTKFNFIVSGKPGTGKTELLKFLTSFIYWSERTVTVEDTLELHCKEINPDLDCIELKIGKYMTYKMAIEEAVRLNTKWLLITEARGEEIDDIFVQFTTGINGILTLHANNVMQVAERVTKMGKNIDEDSVYEYIDIVINLQRMPPKPGEEDNYCEDDALRYIDQIAVYAREEKENRIYMLLDEGKIVSNELPEYMSKKLAKRGFSNPFVCKEVQGEV